MARDDGWQRDPVQAARLGILAACLLPAHLVIAILAALWVGSAALAWIAVVRPRRDAWSALLDRVWRPILAAGTLGIVTFGWGYVTGHGLGGSDASTLVQPFGPTWWSSLVGVFAGAGLLLAIPVAAIAMWRTSPAWSAAYIGAIATLVVGAILWGARLPDFNMFHVFFGGLATIATPIAAVAVWQLWSRLRASTGAVRILRPVLVAVAVMQLALAGLFTIAHLHRFGPFDYEPIPWPSSMTSGRCRPMRSWPTGAPLTSSPSGCRA